MIVIQYLLGKFNILDLVGALHPWDFKQGLDVPLRDCFISSIPHILHLFFDLNPYILWHLLVLYLVSQFILIRIFDEFAVKGWFFLFGHLIFDLRLYAYYALGLLCFVDEVFGQYLYPCV